MTHYSHAGVWSACRRDSSSAGWALTEDRLEVTCRRCRRILLADLAERERMDAAAAEKRERYFAGLAKDCIRQARRFVDGERPGDRGYRARRLPMLDERIEHS